MNIIKYSASRRLLAIARGHPYDREAYAGFLNVLGWVSSEAAHVWAMEISL